LTLTGKQRVVVFDVLLLAYTGVALLVTPERTLAFETGVSFWVLLVGAFLAESVDFTFQFGRHKHGITLAGLPMILGFVFLSPVQLVLARVIGSGLALVLVRKNPPFKAVFNGMLFAADAATGALVFRLIVGTDGLQSGTDFLALLVAITASVYFNVFCVATAIALFEGDRIPRPSVSVLLTEGLVAAGTGTLAVLTAVAVLREPWMGLLVLLPIGAVYLALRFHAELSQRYGMLESVQQFTGIVGRSLALDDLVLGALRQARVAVSARCSGLVVLASTDGLEPGMYVDRGRGVERFDEPLLAEDWRATLDDRQVAKVRLGRSDNRLKDALEAFGETEFLLASISGERLEAVLLVGGRVGNGELFDGDDARLFETLANHAGVAFQNGQLLRRLGELAVHDDLTGLPNRLQFQERAAALVSETLGQRSFCVLLMDLDRFKEVNDTLGHKVGDRLLVEAGRRLQESAGDQGMVARLGGDEFAVLLHDADEHRGRQVAERLQQAIHRPFVLDAVEADVGVSIGVAVAPQDGLDPEMLLQRADVAMYFAKWGQLGIARYEERHDQNSPRRLMMAAKLRTAIEDGALEVVYQPKMRIIDGRITGVEALARWSDDEFGDVEPEEFVELAERVGAMRDLTDWVLGAALRQMRIWKDERDLELPVAVNVSFRDLTDPKFPGRITSLLDEYDVLPERVILELTESSLVAEDQRPIDRLTELRNLGVKLALDDFGTGYSSLAHLRKLPIDELKIDRSFVFNLPVRERDRRLVRSIVDLAHNLDLLVVGEGVESPRAVNVLRQLGCDQIQGHIITRPLAADDLLDWLWEGSENELIDLRAPLRHLRSV
jgi:diguanylate cyclase (GGDEF)-like protein